MIFFQSLPTTSSYGTGTNVGGNSRTVPFSWKSSENSQTFWEDDPNYPIEDIKKLGNLLRDKYQFFFSNEKIPFEESEMISPRLGGGEEYGLCDSFHRTVYPKKAESKQNQVLTIINTPEFMQGVSVEMCSSWVLVDNRKIMKRESTTHFPNFHLINFYSILDLDQHVLMIGCSR